MGHIGGEKESVIGSCAPTSPVVLCDSCGLGSHFAIAMKAGETLLGVGHVAGGKRLLQHGQAGGKMRLQRLLVGTVLLVLDMLNHALNRVEASHANSQCVGCAQRSTQDRLQRLCLLYTSDAADE